MCGCATAPQRATTTSSGSVAGCASSPRGASPSGMPWSTPRRVRSSPRPKPRSFRSPMTTPSCGCRPKSPPAWLPFPTRFACSVLLGLVAIAAGRSLAAQQPDETLVGELARLLAAADARNFDQPLFATELWSGALSGRRQAALAAGRAGDPAAIELLIAALADSDEAVRTNAAFALGMLKDARAIPGLVAFVRSTAAAEQGPSQVEAVAAIARIGGA